MNLAFDFIVDNENNTITVLREFAAERSLVWDAYTKIELLEQWWAPKPWWIETKSMDFREGGAWQYVMCGPTGEKFGNTVYYQKIKIHKQFTTDDVFTDNNRMVNDLLPKSKWVISFSDLEEKTLVTTQIFYCNLKDLEAEIKMGFKEGYTMTTAYLSELLISLSK